MIFSLLAKIGDELFIVLLKPEPKRECGNLTLRLNAIATSLSSELLSEFRRGFPIHEVVDATVSGDKVVFEWRVGKKTFRVEARIVGKDEFVDFVLCNADMSMYLAGVPRKAIDNEVNDILRSVSGLLFDLELVLRRKCEAK